MDQYSHQAPFWSYCSGSVRQARLAQEESKSCVLFYKELDGSFENASPGGAMRDALCFLTQLV